MLIYESLDILSTVHYRYLTSIVVDGKYVSLIMIISAYLTMLVMMN